jgi:PIN domain nuclease of toxin-antitoxin system
MAGRKIVFLDTHVVIWLYQGKKVFSEKVRQLLTESDMRISPIVRLEMMMLFEKKKIDHPVKILTSLKRDFYFDEDRIDFSRLITKSSSLNFTRDPFDRLIVAHALARNSKLVTKHRLIHDKFNGAVW